MKAVLAAITFVAVYAAMSAGAATPAAHATETLSSRAATIEQAISQATK